MKLDRWPLSVTPCSGMQEKEQRTFVMKMLLRRRECAEPEVTGEVGLGGGSPWRVRGKGHSRPGTNEIGAECATFMGSQGLF